ncbi:hypothetical protein [Polaromonas sp.]|uniref:hypothetical protein n=1 Tax=Polaromonas sp. TaxID=1869339 RepID=UPI00352B2EDB
MKVKVHREACCAQDDQLGPLENNFELADDCTVADFIDAVVSSRFLQFSSTLTRMVCRVADKEFAILFSPHEAPAREPQFRVSPHGAIKKLATTLIFNFVFDRDLPN